MEKRLKGLGRPRSELFLRVISAIVLALLAIGSAVLGGIPFILVWGAVFALVFYEWWVILRASAKLDPFWLILGLIYAVFPALSIISIRLSTHGLAALLFLFAVVWGADVGAYFAGRRFGGPKLAPRISPKKTWSGLFGGLCVAALASLVLLLVLGFEVQVFHLFLALALALASACGDLFESWFKRHFGVKDSGHLIPGHGGFMDRLDGFIFAAVFAALIGMIRTGPGRLASGLLAP